MKKLPSFLKIGGFRWKLKSDKPVTDQGNCWGSTHPNTQTMYFEPGMTAQKQHQTAIHEVLHAIWWQQGMTKRGFTDAQEEEIVNALAFGIHQVVVDNPKHPFTRG
jgi:hypothetical protein